MKKIISLLLLMIGMISAQLVNAQSVTITSNPTPANICAGQGTVVSLTANPVGGIVLSYAWTPGGGNTAAINVSPGVTTEYIVLVTFLGGATASDSLTINVLTPPTPTITAGGTLTICAGNSVTLTSSIATTYQWYLNGAIIPGATSITYAATATGSYQSFVTVGTCTGMSVATVVTVNPLPTATATPAGPITTCFGTTVVLTAGVGVGYTYQWQWSPNGLAPWTNVSGQTTQTINANINGYFRIQVTDANICSNVSQ